MKSYLTKFTAIIASMAIVFSLAGCVVENTPGSEDGTKTISQDEENENEEKVEKPENETIEETVCVDWNGVKVTAKELTSDSIWGKEIKFVLENNSENDYVISTEEVIVNNAMIPASIYSTVAAGKKATETMTLGESALKTAGIKNIGQIEIYFYILEPDSLKRVYEPDCVTLKTSAYDGMDFSADDSGKEIYNENGVRLVAKCVDDDKIWGSSVLIYAENNSDSNVTIAAEDMSVNGFMVNSIYAKTIYKGKYAISDLSISESDMKENSIESIEDIEVKFRIYDSDSYTGTIITDPIKITVE